MATLADVQTAADALKADMDQLSGAVQNILAWIADHPPGEPIPDALVQELENAHSSAQASTASLVGGTPPA